MLHEFGARSNAKDSAALTKVCSAMYFWQVDRIAVVSEMRQGKKTIIFLSQYMQEIK